MDTRFFLPIQWPPVEFSFPDGDSELSCISCVCVFSTFQTPLLYVGGLDETVLKKYLCFASAFCIF